jgi:hypothetical protein
MSSKNLRDHVRGLAEEGRLPEDLLERLKARIGKDAEALGPGAEAAWKLAAGMQAERLGRRAWSGWGMAGALAVGVAVGSWVRWPAELMKPLAHPSPPVRPPIEEIFCRSHRVLTHAEFPRRNGLERDPITAHLGFDPNPGLGTELVPRAFYVGARVYENWGLWGVHIRYRHPGASRVDLFQVRDDASEFPVAADAVSPSSAELRMVKGCQVFLWREDRILHALVSTGLPVERGADGWLIRGASEALKPPAP